MRSTSRIAMLIAVIIAGLAPATLVMAANCGGSVVCQCGDTVISDYLMTSDLGPCPRLPGSGVDTIGLTLKKGVTLDCQGHTISGPGDKLKNSFGVRVGSSSGALVLGVSINNCAVTKFWWGIFVQNARDVHIDNSNLFENGWKDPTQNGTGYGVNITSSEVVRLSGSRITDNGNEGVHLSMSSTVLIDGNVFTNNGREQLYMIHADDNIITQNRTQGGTQGLEMRYSSGNQFSFNQWLAAPLHMLENDDDNNTFTYETFDGRVRVGSGSGNNQFLISEFTNPEGICLSVAPVSSPDIPPYILKGYFKACDTEVVTTAAVTFNRSVNNLRKLPRSAIVQFPGCTADVNMDANVDATDRQAVLDALNSVVGDAQFDARADFNHDGAINAQDLAILDAQFGPCSADLLITSISSPPAVAVPGSKFAVTDTTHNHSGFSAGTSRTQYYISLDTAKGTGDKLVGGRPVPALGPNADSTGSFTVTIPANTANGTYFLIACADDKGDVLESDETNNCLATSSTVQVGKPDLVEASVSEPPAVAARGGKFVVTDTVVNTSNQFPAGASTTRYYLSLDATQATGDKILNGTRAVPALGPGDDSTGTITVSVPQTTVLGSYFLIACADDKNGVAESDETNNCQPSTSKVQVTP